MTMINVSLVVDDVHDGNTPSWFNIVNFCAFEKLGQRSGNGNRLISWGAINRTYSEINISQTCDCNWLHFCELMRLRFAHALRRGESMDDEDECNNHVDGDLLSKLRPVTRRRTTYNRTNVCWWGKNERQAKSRRDTHTDHAVFGCLHSRSLTLNRGLDVTDIRIDVIRREQIHVAWNVHVEYAAFPLDTPRTTPEWRSERFFCGLCRLCC